MILQGVGELGDALVFDGGCFEDGDAPVGLRFVVLAARGIETEEHGEFGDGLVGTGFVSIKQTRTGIPPQVSATVNGVTAKGGQAPAFDVQTGSVKVGTKPTTVNVPAVTVEKAGQNQAAPAMNNAM